jgi:hypothetical protein
MHTNTVSGAIQRLAWTASGRRRGLAMAAMGGLILMPAMLASLAGCGGHERGLQPTADPGMPTNTATPEAVSLDGPAPAGIKAELWKELTGALRAALEQRDKAASGVPLAEETRVADFVIVADAHGAAQAGWSFVFSADYNHNGKVGADDLVPVAMFYGATSSDDNWQSAKAADGNHDHRVDLGDVAPLGIHFDEAVSGFEVQTADAPEETAAWTALQQVPYNPHMLRTVDGVVQFHAGIPSAHVGSYYRSVPYFAPPAGAASYGLVSNAQRYYGGNAGPGAWPMAGHDTRGTYRGDAPGPDTMTISWFYQDEDFGYGGTYNSPVICQDEAVYTSYNHFAVFNTDGTLRWDSGEIYPFNYFAPVIGNDGTIYCINNHVNNGIVFAMRPDRTVLWSTDIGYECSPVLLVGNALYIHTTASLVCLSLQGVPQWSYDLGRLSIHLPAPPVLTTTGLIALAHGNSALALTTDGGLAWKRTLDDDGGDQAIALSNGSVVVEYGTGICAFDAQGNLLWHTSVYSVYSNLVLASDNSLRYICHPKSYGDLSTLRAVSQDGTELWSQVLSDSLRDTSLILDSEDKLYAYLGYEIPHVTCYKADGTVQWDAAVQPGQSQNPGILCLGADGTLFLWYSYGVMAIHDGGYSLPDPPVPSAGSGTYCDRICVSWPAALHTNSYRIYRDGAALPLAEVTGTQYDDYNILDDSLHSYTVSGINVLGEGAQSTPAQGRIKVLPSIEQAPGDWAMQGHDAQHTYRSNIIGPSAAKLKWSYTPDDTNAFEDLLFNCPVFSKENTAYLALGQGTLVALKPDGSEVWRIKLGNSASTPAIGADGTIYCTAQQYSIVNNQAVLDFARVYAINPNRTVNWFYQSAGTTSHNSATGVTLDASGNLHCLLVTGELATLSPSGNLLQQGQLDSHLDYTAAPVIGPEGNTYLFSLSTSFYTSLYAFDPTGAALWETGASAGTTEGILGGPTITADGRVYVPGLSVSWFDPDGNRTMLEAGTMLSNLALAADGRVFFAGGPPTGLDWVDSTGAIHAFAEAPTGGESSLILDVAGKAYYVGKDSADTSARVVYCYSSAGALLWSQPVGTLNIFPGLALRDDGALFVTTADSLLAFADQ